MGSLSNIGTFFEFTFLRGPETFFSIDIFITGSQYSGISTLSFSHTTSSIGGTSCFIGITLFLSGEGNGC